MKQLNILLVALLACMGFVACSNDDEDYKPGKWDANPDYADVYFPVTSVTEELDPTEPTDLQIAIVRRNTVGEISVPLKIEGEGEEIFTVSPAQFADGDSVGYATLSFPEAKIGTKYTVNLKLDGADFVSEFSTNTLFTYTVTRVKWNPAGYVELDGQRYDGYAAYTEDLVTTFFGVQNVTYYVQVQEREDRPGYFRVFNPYGEAYPYNDPGDYDADNDYFIFIDATNPSKVYIPMACDLGCDWGYGNFFCHSLAGYYLAKGMADTAADYYGKYEDGAITFPAGALLFGMMDYNNAGMYTSNGSGKFKLLLDPSKQKPELYRIDLTKGTDDFEFEEVFTGAFTSGILGTSSEATLYRGTCENKKDSCDGVFEEEYGTVYGIIDPYGPDAPIYFGVSKDGKITTPYYKPQATGMKVMGADVYATINPKKSSFAENEVILNITFTNADGSIEYGTANEVLANITWTKVATGTYTYSQFFEGDDPDLELYVRDDMPNVYKIEHWGNDVDFFFTWDKNTNKCVVSDQYIGFNHQSYGAVWVDEVSDYAGEELEPSYYDPETSTFNFGVVYYVSAGVFGHGYETFTLDPVAAAAPKAAKAEKKVAKTSFNKNMQRAQKLVGKKVSVKDVKDVMGAPLF